MSEIEVLPAGQLSLFELADIANREYALALQSFGATLEHAIHAGEALLAAKAQVQHGEWLPWLKDNFDGSRQTGQAWMRAAKSQHAGLLTGDETSLRKALQAGARRESSVTYVNQPGIGASGGRVPLAGTSHLYRVEKLLWPDQVETVIDSLLIPRSLHVCCGKSRLGDVRVDNDSEHEPDLVADAASLPIADNEYESVLCDPPYNGEFQWNHNMLEELARVASRRIVFQHWFIPANTDGRYRKDQAKFGLTGIYVWQPKTYFGRAQLISVFDAL